VDDMEVFTVPPYHTHVIVVSRVSASTYSGRILDFVH
jgi:hypothetical protein